MDSGKMIVALIVAAGSGTRAGGDIPKQYRDIAGQPVLSHAIDHIVRHKKVTASYVVIGEGQTAFFDAALAGRGVAQAIIGGDSRRQSVRNGLEAIAAAGGADIVLIHDAARPFLPEEVLDRLLTACETHDGAIPAIAVTDSLAHKDGATARREDFVHVQTPQAFDFGKILAAHRNWTSEREATDDAEIARAAGLNVVLIEGDPRLKKITFAEDFAMASPHLSVTRTGMGFDVHAFASGDHVWLGGVRIDHERALAGHSDADVALHALTDAILGALAAGDIGDHFPPSDSQWKDASSDRFLARAGTLAAEAGMSVAHCDLTIICESPKIGPHRQAMRERIAEILDLPVASVSVKATTSEGLGFTGRGEGIAAQAVATLVGGQV